MWRLLLVLQGMGITSDLLEERWLVLTHSLFSVIFANTLIHFVAASCMLLWLWHIWQHILLERCFSFPSEGDPDVAVLRESCLNPIAAIRRSSSVVFTLLHCPSCCLLCFVSLRQSAPSHILRKEGRVSFLGKKRQKVGEELWEPETHGFFLSLFLGCKIYTVALEYTWTLHLFLFLMVN